MTSSGLREIVILTKILLTTDDMKYCAKGDTVLGWHPQRRTMLSRDVDVV